MVDKVTMTVKVVFPRFCTTYDIMFPVSFYPQTRLNAISVSSQIAWRIVCHGSMPKLKYVSQVQDQLIGSVNQVSHGCQYTTAPVEGQSDADDVLYVE